MAELLYLNGDYMAPAEGRVSCEDRGYNFGDGVYEVVRIYSGVPFTMREHLERQVRSAQGLSFDVPLSVQDFEDVCRELIERSGLKEALIYTQVTRGTAPRNHVYSDDIQPNVMAFIRPAPKQPAEWRTAGAAALPVPENRWNMCHLKTIALLPNILAKNEAHRQGCVEGFFYETDGTVTEGTATNAWMVRGGELWTHPLGTKVLPGITRAQIVKVASEIGVKVHEEKFTLDEAKAADEVFMSASNTELLPISRLGEVKICTGEPGSVYRRLHEAYRNNVAKICGLAELEPIS